MHESAPQVNTPFTARPVTPKAFTLAIVESVAARHGVSVADIFGQCRLKKIVIARHEAIVEVVEARPHWSYPEVARLFGGRDHTTIMHAVKKSGRAVPRKGAAGLPNRRHECMGAARVIGDWVQGYETAAAQIEYRAAMAVANFVRSFALPSWARTEGGAE